MATTQISQQIIDQTITKIKKLEQTTNDTRFSLAKEFWNAKELIDWRKTKYKTFVGMIEQETHYSGATAERYMYFYRNTQWFGWSDIEIMKLLDSLGWTKTLRACAITTKRVKIDTLIKRFKNIKNMELSQMKVGEINNEYRYYSVGLPKEYADKLDGILKTHGMSIGPKRRNNVNQAVMSLLDAL